MRKLHNIKMKPKLIGLFLVVGLLPLLLIAIISSILATNALMGSAYEQLESVREIKKTQIQKFFNEREGDLGVLVETVEVLRDAAFDKLATAQELKKNHLEHSLERFQHELMVLKDDPVMLTALTEFDDAFKKTGDKVLTAEWNLLARKYDPRLQDILKDTGWYDIFLIHTDGAIVYTAAREADLGMVIPDSSLKNSGLGKAFQQIQGMSAEEVTVADFEAYAPSGGEFAAFMIAQLRDEYRQLKGYIAFQIPTQQINDIVQQRKGMGETGESFLVGHQEDLLSYRSTRVVKEAKIGGTNIGEQIQALSLEAFAGQSGQTTVTGTSGDLELVVYDPIESSGLDWALISTIAVEEAIAPQIGERDFYKEYITKYDYYDLFLIHPEGLAFYTVEHESDYRTNMMTGQFSSSNLGKLVTQVLETKQFGMADFAPYSPSNDEPAAFIAQPVIHDDEVQLIVALQLSLDAINSVMQQRDGMGASGETYLVGSDTLMRSDSYLDPESHTVKAAFANPEKGKVDTEAAQKALSGELGSGVIRDYMGNKVLSAYAPLTLWGNTWALLAEIDANEVRMPVYILLVVIVIVAIAVGSLIAYFAFSLAQGITAPLIQGVEFTQKVANGDLTADMDVDQEDEIGMLANALNGMTAKLRGIVADVKGAADNVSYGSQQMSSSSEEGVTAIFCNEGSVLPLSEGALGILHKK